MNRVERTLQLVIIMNMPRILITHIASSRLNSKTAFNNTLPESLVRLPLLTCSLGVATRGWCLYAVTEKRRGKRAGMTKEGHTAARQISDM